VKRRLQVGFLEAPGKKMTGERREGVRNEDDAAITATFLKEGQTRGEGGSSVVQETLNGITFCQ